MLLSRPLTPCWLCSGGGTQARDAAPRPCSEKASGHEGRGGLPRPGKCWSGRAGPPLSSGQSPVLQRRRRRLLREALLHMRPPEPAKGSREAGLGRLPRGSGGKPLPEMRVQLTRNKKRPRQKTGATWSSDHPANRRPLTCPAPGCTAAGTRPPSSTVLPTLSG